jgi:glycosyltransferase involved in cell wall biosynthesis
MLISVVVPTYNRADILGRTIASVLAQSLPPDEVIVVDDGSTDDTAALVATFGSRVRYLRQANAGVSVARNHGASLAGGRWLAFVDSDDLWRPRKLELQMGVLQRTPGTRWSITGCNMIGLDDAELAGREGFEAAFPVFRQEGLAAEALLSRYLERRDIEVNGEQVAILAGDAYEALFVGNFVLPSSSVVERALYAELGGFDADFRLAEETEFYHRLAARSPVAVLLAPLVGYRIGRGGGQISPANSETLILNALRSVDAARMLRSRTPRVDALWQHGRAGLLRRLAYTRLSNLDRQGVRAALRDAWATGAPRDMGSLGLFAASLLPPPALRGLHQLKRSLS